MLETKILTIILSFTIRCCTEQRANGDQANMDSNSAIKYKYETILPNLIPEQFKVTESSNEMLKQAQDFNKRRKHFFKRTCKNKYSYLEKQLLQKLKYARRFSLQQYFKNCLRYSYRKSTPEHRINFYNKRNFVEDAQLEMSIKKRSYQDGINKDSSCVSKGERGGLDGSINMCKECLVMQDLGPYIYPRFFKEIKCGNTDEDKYCLSREGACIENIIHVKFLHDEHKVGREKLSEWISYIQAISTACSCEIFKESPLNIYIK